MHETRRRLEIMARITPVLAVLLICLIAGSALAGGTPMTNKGNKQLVFLFDGLSNLRLRSYFHPGGFPEECYYGCNDYDDCECWPCGGGLGFRYFINDNRAVRVGVNVAIGSWEIKDHWEETCTEFGLSLLYEKYLPHIHSVAPYLGAGCGFAYAKGKWTETDDDYEEECTATVFRVMGVAGFQWYFTEGLSLGGEYRPTFGYETGEVTVDGDTVHETSGYALNHRTASVFLGVHLK
jgi:hypothetical protein